MNFLVCSFSSRLSIFFYKSEKQDVVFFTLLFDYTVQVTFIAECLIYLFS